MMNANRGAQACQYIDNVHLPAPRSRSRGVGGEGADAIAAALDTSRKQAAVVGSEVVSFAEGVGATHRQDLVNSTLLAQLAANKQVSDRSRLFDWYDAYFDALANIGWAVQARDFAVHVESGTNFEAHKAIIQVATLVLGPSPTALALVTGTLDALKSMDEESPWLTLFARESQSADTARFQISALDKGADGEPFVSLMAFGLQARRTMTQVLFFRSRASDVTLRHCSGQMSIDAAIVAAVRQPLRAKLAAHAADYVKTLPEL